MEFNITAELNKLPARPGVYIMHNEKDEIIYVGKAISLKNRVRQYFQSSRNLSEKIKKMVSNVAYFEYIVTDSELEALVLECNLIKKHRPRYNTMLKDDKGYPYIKVTVSEEFPRVLFARNIKKDKSKYFGPYTSAKAVKDTIELLKKLFMIRSCNRCLPKDIGKERACLNYHIKQCQAPCQGYISKAEYGKQIKGVLEFLGGNYKDIAKNLEEKMKQAAAELEFEEAARYRDLLESVRHIADKQKINDSSFEDKDVIACAIAKRDYSEIYESVIQVFFIRNGKLIGREHFHMTNEGEISSTEVISAFVKQYYSGTPFVPKNILLQTEIEDLELVTQWLKEKRGSGVNIVVPIKGRKEKLVELAFDNAAMVLSKDMDKLYKEDKRIKEALETIKNATGIEKLDRIESFDISNISGFLSVGSMVVFENGKPKSNDYRKFKIKSVVGPNDYASMREVLERRFLHGISEGRELEAAGEDKMLGSFSHLPDVIFMDGGKGQVNVALEVLKEMELNIPVCGMVKDDRHQTRGLYYNNEIIPIDTHGEAFRLITRIQDETHRFAIEYHRSLRAKGQVHSILDDIDGIGPRRRKALMKYFSSIEEIKKADIDTLAKVPSMDRKSAKAVVDFFEKNGKIDMDN
ncbi:MAG: excinuclease ABC subunit UvrC [Lachnospiraceae bacterium]|nr:excinuclease ABC subunit UvrC [Lachnospiraceae bacterium]